LYNSEKKSFESFRFPQCFATSAIQALPQIGHVLNWRIIHTILHFTPYSTFNWIMIRKWLSCVAN